MTHGRPAWWIRAALSLSSAAACTSAKTPATSGDASPSPGAVAYGGLAGGVDAGGNEAAGAAVRDGAIGGSIDAARDAASTSADAGATSLVHLLGRFDTRDPAGPRFEWPGSAIAATFTGTGIDVSLEDAGTNFFAVVIDGGAPARIATTSAASSYTLASGLTAGQHTLVLTKTTESYVGLVQYLGLSPHAGALVPSPEPFARRIEYVGDSITCGYGDLGVGPSCTFSPDTEDETVAYGALTASALGAEATVIAYSGKGMLRDGNGSTTEQMPVLFERTLADDATSTWAFAAPPPDVVVINLGTNDFSQGDPGAAFQTAYTSFLGQLRGHYASAPIICTLSPMLADPGRSQAAAYIQGAIASRAAAGDARVAYVAFDVQEAQNGYGCDYHPSTTTHGLMATTLEPAIRSATGW